jgi:hypothetical protein
MSRRGGRSLHDFVMREAASTGQLKGDPEPPWPVGSATNCKRNGWKAYFAGRGREDCPYPLGRIDLQAGYREGWDVAGRAALAQAEGGGGE